MKKPWDIKRLYDKELFREFHGPLLLFIIIFGSIFLFIALYFKYSASLFWSIGAILGCVIGFVVIFLRDFVKKRFKL